MERGRKVKAKREGERENSSLTENANYLLDSGLAKRKSAVIKFDWNEQIDKLR
jgi:hypothetical protein